MMYEFDQPLLLDVIVSGTLPIIEYSSGYNAVKAIIISSIFSLLFSFETSCLISSVFHRLCPWRASWIYSQSSCCDRSIWYEGILESSIFCFSDKSFIDLTQICLIRSRDRFCSFATSSKSLWTSPSIKGTTLFNIFIDRLETRETIQFSNMCSIGSLPYSW